MSTPVTLTAGQLTQGYCMTTFQQLLEDFVSATSGELPGNFNAFNFGDTEPAVDDRDKPWFRTVSGVPDRWYVYSGGWISPHPVPQSDNERRVWVGTAAQLWSYDGGDGTDPAINPPTDTTGAMWVVDTAFSFKMPIGAGTNGTAYDGLANKTIAVGDTGGEERHTLIGDEIPDHQHQFQYAAARVGVAPADQIAVSGTTADVGSSVHQTATDGGGDKSHENLPPYLGVIFMKRSSRKYYTV